MVSLIDNLSTDVWKEVSAGERGDGYIEYHILQKKHNDPTTLALFLTDDRGDAVTATLTGTQANRDPFKAVAVCEFKLNGQDVVGMDLCGDVVLKKS